MPKLKSSLVKRDLSTDDGLEGVKLEFAKLVEGISSSSSAPIQVHEDKIGGTSSSAEDDNVNVTIGNIPTLKPLTVFDDTSDESDNDEEVETDRKAAWIDENDVFSVQEVVDYQGRSLTLGSKANNDYKQNLEERYKSIMGAPNWAKKRQKDGTLDVLNKTGNLVTKQKTLKKGVLEVQKLDDLNKETHTEGAIITSVLFHPTSTVALVAGTNGIASLFQVDGKENTKLQSIKFKDFPISCAEFLRNGDEFFVGSRFHKYCYSHDLISGKTQEVRNSTLDITNLRKFGVSSDGRFIAICGRFGDIILLASKTKEHIATLHMNGEVTSLGFYEDKMFSHGSAGDVYVWDLKTRECVHKFIDEGCLTGTSVAASPNGMMIACGSSSGVVNLYDLEKACLDHAPKPLRVIDNLVTEVDFLKFNATSELLSFSSQEKLNAVKLLHCPSMTVFSNFPPFHAKYHRIQCVDFSPNSGFMAFGDNRKSAHLFRLKHYGNY